MRAGKTNCLKCGSFYFNTAIVRFGSVFILFAMLAMLIAGLVSDTHALRSFGSITLAVAIYIGATIIAALIYFGLPIYYWYYGMGPKE